MNTRELKDRFITYIGSNYFLLAEEFIENNYRVDFDRLDYDDYETFINDFCSDEFDDYVWHRFLETGEV